MNSLPPKKSWSNNEEDTDQLPAIKTPNRTDKLDTSSHPPTEAQPSDSTAPIAENISENNHPSSLSENDTSTQTEETKTESEEIIAEEPEVEQFNFPGENGNNDLSADGSNPDWLVTQIDNLSKGTLAVIDTQTLPNVPHTEPAFEPIPVTPPLVVDQKDNQALAIPETPLPEEETASPDTPEETPPTELLRSEITSRPPEITLSPFKPTRRQAIYAIVLLCIALVQVINTGAAHFISNQGWAATLGSQAPANNNTNLINNINQQIKQTPQPLTTATATSLTPQQYIDLIVQNMTLDQKLGQMMLIQFNGATYSPNLSTMINKYNVGAAIIFAANGNVINGPQLKSLVQQMTQNSSPLPLAVTMDQEGGYVNRLLNILGPRPAAATLGATNNPQKARDAGKQDAQDLQQFGININLAPVVDVDTADGEIHEDLRSFGTTPEAVIRMTEAYLQGLQQSGKVIGTLKHFPGLGSVTVDPHHGVPHLKRNRAQMEQIDWAPYRALIQQGNVYSIMVTHEIVDAIDSSKPASISEKVIQGILRNDLGYQGVVMTDSLTMAGVTDFYTPGEAAALSVEAGADLLMGASTPNEVASMFDGLKKAMQSGAISQTRIDESVRRLLMMKYAMGLIKVPRP